MPSTPAREPASPCRDGSRVAGRTCRMSRRAFFCMAYGSPPGDDGIEAYYTHIRGGRKPRRSLAELTSRYRAIGGSPLTSITRAQTAAIGRTAGLPAFVGDEARRAICRRRRRRGRESGRAQADRPSAGASFRGDEPWRVPTRAREVVARRAHLRGRAFMPIPPSLPRSSCCCLKVSRSPGPIASSSLCTSLPARIVAEGEGSTTTGCSRAAAWSEAGMKLPSWGVCLPVGEHHRRAVAGSRPAAGHRGGGRSRCPGVPHRIRRRPPGDPLRPRRGSPGSARARDIKLRRTASFNTRPEFRRGPGPRLSGTLSTDVTNASPRCTYRLQLSRTSPSRPPPRAGYLASLGVSHAHFRHSLQAAPASTHGYDVVDPHTINKELGGEPGFHRFMECSGRTA